MYKLNYKKILGNQLYKMVWREVRRRKMLGEKASLTSFCRDAGISKQQLIQYKHGATPSGDGVLKIASGLKSWGVEVEVEY